MKVTKRLQERKALTDGLAEYLFSCCDRLGLLIHLPVDDWVRLADDPAERDRFIRDAWREHRAALLERWAAEHPGERPKVLDYLAADA